MPVFNETSNQVVWRFSPDNSIIDDLVNWDEIEIEWKVHNESISEHFSFNNTKSLEIP